MARVVGILVRQARPEYGNGQDGNIIIHAGNTISVDQLYELDNLVGVTTKRGVNKGLNYGVGTYAGQIISTITLTVEATAMLTVSPYIIGAVNPYFGQLKVGALVKIANAGSITVVGKGWRSGAAGDGGSGVGCNNGTAGGTGAGPTPGVGGGGGGAVGCGCACEGLTGCYSYFPPGAGNGGAGTAALPNTWNLGDPIVSALGSGGGGGGGGGGAQCWTDCSGGSHNPATGGDGGLGGGGGYLQIGAPTIINTGTIRGEGQNLAGDAGGQNNKWIGDGCIITGGDGGAGGQGAGGVVYIASGGVCSLGTGLVTAGNGRIIIRGGYSGSTIPTPI